MDFYYILQRDWCGQSMNWSDSVLVVIQSLYPDVFFVACISAVLYHYVIGVNWHCIMCFAFTRWQLYSWQRFETFNCFWCWSRFYRRCQTAYVSKLCMRFLVTDLYMLDCMAVHYIIIWVTYSLCYWKVRAILWWLLESVCLSLGRYGYKERTGSREHGW